MPAPTRPLHVEIAETRVALAAAPDEGIGGVKAAYLDELLGRVETVLRLADTVQAKRIELDMVPVPAFELPVPEPSDAERSEWPDATRAYVEALESALASQDTPQNPQEVARKKLAAVIADYVSRGLDYREDHCILGRIRKGGEEPPSLTWADLKALASQPGGTEGRVPAEPGCSAEPEPVPVSALTGEHPSREARLARCLGFFASVIKSGEPWTATCQREYEAALASGIEAPAGRQDAEGGLTEGESPVAAGQTPSPTPPETPQQAHTSGGEG